MNVNDAAYATAHDYPGGTESLAPRLAIDGRNMSPAILRGKVNPNDKGHHLTLAEADRMMAVTGDYRMLEALATEHGFVCIPVPNFEGIADQELLDNYTQMIESDGTFAKDFREALADGKIESKEFERLQADMFDRFAHGVELLARIQSMIKD